MAGLRVLPYDVGGAARWIGLAMLVLPAAAAPLVLRDREVRVHCARQGPATGSCAIDHGSSLFSTHEEVPLASVLRAAFEPQAKGGSTVTLVTLNGTVTVSRDVDYTAAGHLVSEVNDFLSHPAAREMDVTADLHSAVPVVFYGLMILAGWIFGALALASSPRVRVELDREMDAVRVVRSYWPFAVRSRSFERGRVSDAIVEVDETSKPEGFRVTLLLEGGAREPLTLAHHTGPRAPHDLLARQIGEFTRRETENSAQKKTNESELLSG